MGKTASGLLKWEVPCDPDDGINVAVYFIFSSLQCLHILAGIDEETGLSHCR
jgi:hypothetical protein